MTIQRRACIAAIAALAGSVAPWALAQADNYPSKPVRLIVPFPPGGGGDTLARLVMNRAAKELGQPLVVENMPGAGGNVGAQTGARAAADGYTLFYGTNGTHAINHALYKNPGFDPRKDFEPISRLTKIAALWVVRPGLNVSSVQEMMQLMRSQPGKITFASAGNGTTSHLAGEMLKSLAKVDIVHVPYRGGAAAMTDLIGGQVDMMIDVMPNTAPQVRGGRVKGLAVSTAQRVSSFSELPTMAESGIAGFDVSAWDAVFAPVGAPKAVIDKVNAAIVRALADPEMRQQLSSRGSEPAPTSPEDLARFVTSEMERWGAAVRASGASVD